MQPSFLFKLDYFLFVPKSFVVAFYIVRTDATYLLWWAIAP